MTYWTKEDIYDEQISPLMTKIIAICKEHQIPMVAQFQYANDALGYPQRDNSHDPELFRLGGEEYRAMAAGRAP
jgi:hypothetical protein